MKATGSYIIARIIKQEVSASGLYIPEAAQTKENQYKVVSVSKESMLSELEEGHTILAIGAKKISEDYVYIHEDNVIAIM